MNAAYVNDTLPKTAKQKKLRLLAALLALFASFAAQLSSAAEITVFAAASLTDSLKEIATGYQNQFPGNKVFFSFDASSTLARQIKSGAPCDIFISADDAKMDMLEKDGLIDKSSRKKLLENSLVIVVATNSNLILTNASDLTNKDISHIAIAEPDTVPAGIYAKEYLNGHGLWNAVNGKIIPTQNVRAALAAVESGDAEAGIVYKTDATISKRTKIALEIPSNETIPISYPIALLKNAHGSATANELFLYLESPKAGSIFQKYGFILPGQVIHP